MEISFYWLDNELNFKLINVMGGVHDDLSVSVTCAVFQGELKLSSNCKPLWFITCLLRAYCTRCYLFEAICTEIVFSFPSAIGCLGCIYFSSSISKQSQWQNKQCHMGATAIKWASANHFSEAINVELSQFLGHKKNLMMGLLICFIIIMLSNLTGVLTQSKPNTRTSLLTCKQKSGLCKPASWSAPLKWECHVYDIIYNPNFTIVLG